MPQLEPHPIAFSAARRRVSPAASDAASTASRATSTSSPPTSASTIRYASRRTLARRTASSGGSSPRAIARLTYAGSEPGDSRIASSTLPHASACGSGEEAPEDEREDATVTNVLALARRVEPDERPELRAVGRHRDFPRLAVLHARDGELLASGEPERLSVLPVHELERQDAHH